MPDNSEPINTPTTAHNPENAHIDYRMEPAHINHVIVDDAIRRLRRAIISATGGNGGSGGYPIQSGPEREEPTTTAPIETLLEDSPDDQVTVMDPDGDLIEVTRAERDRNYVSCYQCDGYTHNDHSHSVFVLAQNISGVGFHRTRVARTTVCESCRDNSFYTCERCEEVFHEDHGADTEENGRHCHQCLRGEFYYHDSADEWRSYPEEDLDSEDEEDDSGIFEYNYKPRPQFLGTPTTKNPYIGFELEVECSNSRYDTARIVDDPRLYKKHDGSLSCGFEIVSHPSTLDEHQKVDYKALFERLVKAGARSHDTSTCGLHFHLSRGDMTEGHKVRLGMLMAFCQNEMETVARRKENTYAVFKKDNFQQWLNRDRYAALNWQNEDTVEFRLFRGTLKADTFMACMELCLAAFQFTHDHRVFNATGTSYEIETGTAIWGKFLKFIGKRKTKFPHLIPYLQSKNFNIGA